MLESGVGPPGSELMDCPHPDFHLIFLLIHEVHCHKLRNSNICTHLIAGKKDYYIVSNQRNVDIAEGETVKITYEAHRSIFQTSLTKPKQTCRECKSLSGSS